VNGRLKPRIIGDEESCETHRPAVSITQRAFNDARRELRAQNQR
jgi:hypothetical protein